VDSFEPRESLEVRRNRDYWMTDADGAQLPYLDSISFRVIEDPQISAEALAAGDIDITSTSNGATIAAVRELGDEFSVTVQHNFNATNYLLIDLDKPGPLQDRRVRCAMSLAIDRDQLNVATTAGFSLSANGLFSSGQQGYLDDNGLPAEQDLDAARALIADYEAEHGAGVEITLGHTPTNSFALTGELLQDWWSQIGLDVRVQTLPQDDLINVVLFGAPDFEVVIWRDHAGVVVDQQYLWWHSDNARPDGEPSLNFGRLRDPSIDAALDAARAGTPERAVAAAEEINRTFARACYYIPLSWVPWAVLSDADVGGLGDLRLPDGTAMIDPVGINGQFRLHTLQLIEG